ncbi:MAG: sulfatase-like hydrolase/transferase [Opitutaceae bacterium]
MLPRLTALLFCFTLHLSAEPLLSSWHTQNSGQYARVYETLADQNAQNAVTTWSHPNNGTGQAMPTYAGVNEISYTATDVFIRSTGLGFHVMGPWYGNEAKTNLFVNYPANSSVIYRFPRGPGTPPINKTLTGGGPIGYFVDGIAMFDSRDAFSYSNSNSADARPNTAFNGDGIWNRDAYVNESVTFDPANAHQAGINHHYHANPPGLRNLLDDSVDYDYATNTYTENFNGKHSPILGWVRDGYPVYGPYGYDDALDSDSGVRRMLSGFTERDGDSGTTNLNTTGRTSLPTWASDVQGIGPSLAANQYGPAVNAAYPLGHYLEDYDYLGDHGQTQGDDFDLDLHNGRFCVTPEFPAGTYAYFVSIEVDGTPNYPYNIGRTFYGSPTGNNENNIPVGAVTYFEGGPEAPLKVKELTADPISEDVTLVWSAIEGGTYQVEESNLVDDWEDLGPEILSDSTEVSLTDTDRLSSDDQRFYRVSLTDIAEFDDLGFVYDAISQQILTSITVTLTTGGPPPPADLGIAPATLLFNGIEVAFVSRPSQYEVTFLVDLNGLLSGDYTVIAEFDGGAGTWTGSYTHNAPQHNILLIIVDDWGIDSSPIDNPTGASLPTMANLESLADSGLRFTNAYSQPVCSPTRATILTGRQPFRHGVGSPIGANLPDSELTLPEIFTAAASNYALASYGKWHLGGGTGGPLSRGGWTEFKGIQSGGVPDYYDWPKLENGTTQVPNETTYSTTEIANDTIDFINAQPSNKPWFAWVAFNAPHTPFHDPLDTNLLQSTWGAGDTDDRSLYEKALEAMDTEIGNILAAVDLSKTNVIIIGDNGTPGQVVQAPFGNGNAKGDLYEGGSHVPLVVAGPIVTASGTTDEPVHCVDLFSTILQLADIDQSAYVPVATEIDSRSFVPRLNGIDLNNKAVVVEAFNDTAGVADPGSGRAILMDGYKLVIFDNPEVTTDVATQEFYYIPDDPNEQTDLLLSPVTETAIAAYNVLVDINDALGGDFDDGGYLVSNVETVYIELPNPGVPAVPNLTNPNGNVEPTEILIGGQVAAFVSRVNASEVDDQYWVKASFDPVAAGLTTGTYNMTVQFRNHPNTGATRIYDALNTFTVD